MSQQLRQLKSRIRSIEGTWKVTRAMEMVSMSKFKSLEMPLAMSRTYFAKLDSIFNNLIAVEENTANAYFKSREQGALGLVVVTSDTGLCGIYNDEVITQAENFIAQHPGREVKLYVYGRKGTGHFRKEGMAVHKSVAAMHGRLNSTFHRELFDAVLADYDAKALAEVHVCYTVYKSAMKHIPTTEKLLNIERKPVKTDGSFIIESGSKGILPDVLPMYLSNKMRLMMLESFVSEHSARMVAMKSSKDNAKELMGDLILLRNKIRQATITKEVIEIISSAEALKG
ncbi:MAG: ATP synthase F1 subunit gamma [Candidatus Omnitrophica bacterium]|nr:ATP synthase F1 subunit gamma [Candidatus Omnitrophota bacterium]